MQYICVHSDQILMYAIVFQVVKGKRYLKDGGMRMGQEERWGREEKAIMFALGKQHAFKPSRPRADKPGILYATCLSSQWGLNYPRSSFFMSPLTNVFHLGMCFCLVPRLSPLRRGVRVSRESLMYLVASLQQWFSQVSMAYWHGFSVALYFVTL